MKSLSRALTVLTELGRHGHPLTLSDITSAVGLHKSTVHRMLATFAEYGLVRRDEANRYVVGLGALDLARAARGEPVPDGAVLPALTALREATGERPSYAVPRAGQLTVTAALDRTEVGEHRSLHATAAGKAYLAYRPHVEIDRYAARAPFPAATDRTIIDAYRLLSALARVRERGYAVEDGEQAAGLRRIGAPVLDHDGLAVAAVGLTVPDRVGHPAELRRLGAAVTACADQVRASLLDSLDRSDATPRVV